LHSTTVFYTPASECILILEADCYTVELYIDLAYIYSSQATYTSPAE